MVKNYSFVNDTFLSSFQNYHVTEHESGGYLIEPRDRLRNSIHKCLTDSRQILIFIDSSDSNPLENQLRNIRLSAEGYIVHSYTSNDYLRFFKKANGFLHDTIGERFYNNKEKAIHLRCKNDLETFGMF